MASSFSANNEEVQQVLRSLARGSKLNFPFVTPSGSSYREELESRLDNFIRRIDNLNKMNTTFALLILGHLDELKNLRDKILAVVDEYLKGNIGHAYSKVEEILDSPLVQKCRAGLTFDLGRDLRRPKNLYRMRVSTERLKDPKDIFHIPFERRHLVSTQRFSISGLPSLYLGESIYVCWEELGRPDLNSVYLSRFESVPQDRFGAKYLNLAYSIELLLKDDDPLGLEDDIVDRLLYESFILMYPLVMACSFTRQHDNAPFNLEYVLPNLLLQAIQKRSSHFDGIAYLSTKSEQIRDSKLGVNYVFPPRNDELKASGTCSYLSKLFKITKPVAWQILDAIDQSRKEVGIEIDGVLELEQQLLANYRKTRFYRFEKVLKELKTQKLQ